MQSLEQYRFAAQVEFTDYADAGEFIALQGLRANRIFAALEPEVYLSEIGQRDFCDTTYSDTAIKIFRHSITGENGYFFWANKKDFAAFAPPVIFD